MAVVLEQVTALLEYFDLLLQDIDQKVGGHVPLPMLCTQVNKGDIHHEFICLLLLNVLGNEINVLSFVLGSSLF